MKKPEEIIAERLATGYGLSKAWAKEAARTLLDDLTDYYSVTELPYMARHTAQLIKMFPSEAK